MLLQLARVFELRGFQVVKQGDLEVARNVPESIGIDKDFRIGRFLGSETM